MKSKEEKIEEKIEIKSISNKGISRNNSSNKSKSRNNSISSSKSNKSNNKFPEETLYSNKSNKSNTIIIKKELQSQKLPTTKIRSKSIEKRKISNFIKINRTQIKPRFIKKIPQPIIKPIKIKKRKFNEEKFKKELEFFKNCEERKKEKIEKLKQEKIKKEIATVNNKKNIHYRKKLPNKQLPSLLERLYTKDLEKRQEKKQILTKIYTPTFKPFLFSKKNNNVIKKRPIIQKQQNTNIYTNNSKTIEDYYDENMIYNETENNQYNIYNEQKNEIIQNSQRNQKMKKRVKFNMEENPLDEKKENEESVQTQIQKRVVVENALRNKLFNRGTKQKRNKSSEIRKI